MLRSRLNIGNRQPKQILSSWSTTGARDSSVPVRGEGGFGVWGGLHQLWVPVSVA